MQQMTALPDSTSVLPPPQEPRSRRFRTFRVVTALILRETGSRDSRASLGFLWTVIDPVASVIILSLVFSMISRTPRLGTNFELYYITGVVPFHLYSGVAGKIANSMRFSRNLLGFPSVTVIDALLARFLLNVFTNVTVFVILVVGAVYYYDLQVYPDMGALILSLTMAAALGLGIGTLNSVLFLASPTYESLWGITNRPMTILSGALFLVSDLPDNLFRYIWWNPMAHMVAEMRHAFYPTAVSGWISPAYVFMVAGLTFTLGLIGLHRYVFDALDR